MTINTIDKTTNRRPRPKKVLEERLSRTAIEAKMKQNHLPAEENIMFVVTDSPYMRGASADWPDIRKVCLNALRDMVPALSYRECYQIVIDTVQLYDTQIVSVHRAIPDRKRLAYFLSELISRMVTAPAYLSRVRNEVFGGEFEPDETTLRGIILRRIATADVLMVCGQFFRANTMRAEQFVARLAEEKRTGMRLMPDGVYAPVATTAPNAARETPPAAAAA